MACGTGRFFTILHLAERVVEENDGKSRILLLLLSISFLSQTLKKSTAQGHADMRTYAVCSEENEQ